MQRLRTVSLLDVSAVAGHHAMPAALLFSFKLFINYYRIRISTASDIVQSYKNDLFVATINHIICNHARFREIRLATD